MTMSGMQHALEQRTGPSRTALLCAALAALAGVAAIGAVNLLAAGNVEILRPEPSRVADLRQWSWTPAQTQPGSQP